MRLHWKEPRCVADIEVLTYEMGCTLPSSRTRTHFISSQVYLYFLLSHVFSPLNAHTDMIFMPYSSISRRPTQMLTRTSFAFTGTYPSSATHHLRCSSVSSSLFPSSQQTKSSSSIHRMHHARVLNPRQPTFFSRSGLSIFELLLATQALRQLLHHRLRLRHQLQQVTEK